ncbi:MAG: SIS domain-containing protein, partial [Micromonosporaceae bacterium]
VEGERVAVIGCGSSYFNAQAYAGLREQSGQGETDAFPASEFPAHRRYDRVVAISRSGTTTEVLRAVATVPADTPSIAIVADPSSPLAQQVDSAVAIKFADEESVVQTRFATSALMLLRAGLGEPVEPLVAAAKKALTEPLPSEAHTARLLTFLGVGWTIGIANEAAHKLREAAQLWTDSYSAMEYRHGANCLADEKTLVWILGTPPSGLVDQTTRYGAKVHVGEADPMVELVRVHRLAVELTNARGLDPDRPRNLARSIILS